ncbi:MAG TPA: YfhO family protein [Chitinophagales bacterium]|nr:YfhO family protein [Chitinophagales bacterium]
MKKKVTTEENGGNYFEKHALPVLLGLTALLILIVFYDFLVFDKLYLFKGLASDSMVDTYPNYIHIADYLRSEGLPMWSFSQGMGQSIFPFSFPDPLVTMLYALGRDHLAYGIAYMEIAKIFLCSIFFYLLLKKLSVTGLPAIVGALSYSFSSFVIVGSCWNIFSTEALYLVLLLYGFEKLYQDKNRLILPVVIALIAILQPFDLWLMGLFLLLYIVVRLFENNSIFSRASIVLMAEVGLLCALGVAMGSILFLSEVKAMINSPRVAGHASYFDELLSKSIFSTGDAAHNVTALMRFFSSDMLGGSNQFKGWYNFMEAPLFYCGLLNLLLMPQVFRFGSRRKKIIYAVWFAIFILPVIFPFLRYAFWLFTGDYYRLFGFFLSVLIILYSTQALSQIIKHSKPDITLLGGTLVILLLALYFPYQWLQTDTILNTELRSQIAMLLIFYTALIALLGVTQYNKTAQYLLCLTFFAELTYFSSKNINERMALTGEEHEQKFGFLDYTIEAVNYLNKTDSSFYRISKDYWSGPVNHPSFNDAKIQRYRGTGSYHSFNQPSYVRFLAGMNIIDQNDEAQTRWLIGLRNEPMLHSHVSLKYFLSKNPVALVHINYDSLTTIGDVRIYKNKYALPLGFTYRQKIDSKTFSQLSQQQKSNMLYKAVVINDSLYGKLTKELKVADISDTSEYTSEEYINDIDSLETESLTMESFSNNRIKGSITVSDNRLLFFSIPFSDSWSAKVDGKKHDLLRVNIGFSGLMLKEGTHKIELSFWPSSFKTSVPINIVGILLYLCLMAYQYKQYRSSQNKN